MMRPTLFQCSFVHTLLGHETRPRARRRRCRHSAPWNCSDDRALMRHVIRLSAAIPPRNGLHGRVVQPKEEGFSRQRRVHGRARGRRNAVPSAAATTGTAPTHTRLPRASDGTAQRQPPRAQVRVMTEMGRRESHVPAGGFPTICLARPHMSGGGRAHVSCGVSGGTPSSSVQKRLRWMTRAYLKLRHMLA